MPKQKVVIRVDGSNEIGLGHISRCCALADMLKHEFEIVFYTRAHSQNIINDIKNYCTELIQLDSSTDYIKEASTWIKALSGHEIVVLDGYNFDTNYQQKIKAKGCKLICIDDIHTYHFVADVVINHAPGIDKKVYSCEDYTQLRLGTEYVLLKKIFLDEARLNKSSFNSENSEVLICLGGADPNNFTCETLEKAMCIFKTKTINVVVGAAYLHLNSLQKIMHANEDLRVYINIKPAEMLALMKTSYIAITAASTISFEYLCTRGRLFLECIADNQKNLFKYLIQNKYASSFKGINSIADLNKIIYNQHMLIDGKSDMRLREIFKLL